GRRRDDPLHPGGDDYPRVLLRRLLQPLRALRSAALPNELAATADDVIASLREAVMARNQKKGEEDGVKVICRNKRAFHEYEISDRLECGVVLTGTEDKRVRDGD